MIDNPYPEDCIEAGYSPVCDECAEKLSEADALPTLRSHNWLILVVLALALTGWAVLCAVGYGLWLLKSMAEAAAIAVGGSV